MIADAASRHDTIPPAASGDAPSMRGGADTEGVAVADAAGRVVALTQSLGNMFGSGLCTLRSVTYFHILCVPPPLPPPPSA